MENFILPEKWAVRGTNVNGSTIKDKYREIWNKFVNSSAYGFYNTSFYYIDSKGKHDYSNYLVKGYTEITLEQFLEHVIKQPKVFNNNYPIF